MRINDPAFLEQHRCAPTDFTRRRRLPFASVIVFLLNLVRASLQTELDRFFQVLTGAQVHVRAVTKSAFSQARRKLLPSAFRALLFDANLFFYQRAPVQRWHGFRLVAGDGTCFRLPDTPENQARFGVANGRNGAAGAQARSVCLFDPLNELILNGALGSYYESERDLLVQTLDACGEGDLLLLDRGFPAHWLLALLLARGLDFCCRVPRDFCSAVSAAQGQRDIRITLQQPSSHQYAQYERYQIPREPITLRLVVLPRPGEDILLLTSLLDQERFGYEMFDELYRERWPVEELYKRIICRIEITDFTGMTEQTILQDFYAKLLTANLTAMLSLPARVEIENPAPERRFPQQLNWTQAFGKMKDTIVHLLLGPDPESILLQLHELFRKTRETKRSDRHFPRKVSFHKRVHHMAYKPIT